MFFFFANGFTSKKSGLLGLTKRISSGSISSMETCSGSRMQKGSTSTSPSRKWKQVCLKIGSSPTNVLFNWGNYNTGSIWGTNTIFQTTPSLLNGLKNAKKKGCRLQTPNIRGLRAGKHQKRRQRHRFQVNPRGIRISPLISSLLVVMPCYAPIPDSYPQLFQGWFPDSPTWSRWSKAGAASQEDLPGRQERELPWQGMPSWDCFECTNWNNKYQFQRKNLRVNIIYTTYRYI